MNFEKKVLVVGEFMWPWYQEALKNAFEDIGLEACGFGWFNSFWKKKTIKLSTKAFTIKFSIDY